MPDCTEQTNSATTKRKKKKNEEFSRWKQIFISLPFQKKARQREKGTQGSNISVEQKSFIYLSFHSLSIKSIQNISLRRMCEVYVHLNRLAWFLFSFYSYNSSVFIPLLSIDRHGQKQRDCNASEKEANQTKEIEREREREIYIDQLKIDASVNISIAFVSSSFSQDLSFFLSFLPSPLSFSLQTLQVS